MSTVELSSVTLDGLSALSRLDASFSKEIVETATAVVAGEKKEDDSLTAKHSTFFFFFLMARREIRQEKVESDERSMNSRMRAPLKPYISLSLPSFSSSSSSSSSFFFPSKFIQDIHNLISLILFGSNRQPCGGQAGLCSCCDGGSFSGKKELLPERARFGMIEIIFDHQCNSIHLFFFQSTYSTLF